MSPNIPSRNKNKNPAQVMSNPAPKHKKNRRKRKKSGGGPGSLSAVGRRYLTSLLYPESIRAKIPDVCSIPTSMVSATLDFQISVNTAGTGGCKFVVGSNLNNSTFVQEDPTTSNDALYAYVAGVLYPANTAFAGAFSASRLVSAAIQLEYIGTSLNDQGTLYVSSSVVGGSFTEGIPTSTTAQAGARDNIRLNLRDGAYIRWRPLDDTNDDFSSSAAARLCWNPVIHVSGALISSTPLRGRVTLNFEAIPSADTLSFQETELSPVDPSAYNTVRELITSISSFESFQSASKYVLGGSAGTNLGALTALSLSLFGAQALRQAKSSVGIMQRRNNYLSGMDMPD